ncbi:hypothetical protein FSOLCH5_010815 [Fusarium solani]
MVNPSNIVQVVVVGAGLSGLRAATEVHRAGLSYVVLEARDQVGGKTLSVPTNDQGTNPVDMGAAWINNSTQMEMFALAQEFGFDLIEQRSEGNSIYQGPGGDVSTIPYGSLGLEAPEDLQQADRLLAAISELVEQANNQFPHLGPNATTLDSQTVAQLAQSIVPGELSKMLTRRLTRSLIGVEPEDMSALYLVSYLKGTTGLQNALSEKAGGGQYLRNRQGNQGFAVRLAEKLDPKHIKLSTPVRKITQGGPHTLVETADGTVYQTSKVIVAVPLKLYDLIEFRPRLPGAKQALSSTTLGHFSKTVLTFSEPWWLHANLSGVFSSDGPGLLSFARETSSSEDGQYSITCFHVGEQGRQWASQKQSVRQNAVLKQFRSAYGTVVGNIPKPLRIIEQNWNEDQWMRGAPSSVMPPGLLTHPAGMTIREPFQNVHFIGSDTSPDWKGYMEGAIRSGIRGAQEVIRALSSTP